LPHQSAEGSDGRDVGRSDLSAVLDPSEMPDAAAAVVLPDTRPAGRGTPAWEIASLVAILGVAFVLRLCWLAIADAQPGVITSGDPFFYDYFARHLVAGHGFIGIPHGEPTAQWPPGYPAVLAVIFKLFGHKIVLAKLLNVLLGTATCLLAYLIGKKVFDRNAGLVAAAVLAIFPSQVFQPTLVMTETLATFLVAALVCVVVFFAVDSLSWQRAAAIGAFIGLITYVRGETILLALPLVVVWAIAGRSFLSGLRYGAIALAATALVILPWVTRNWIEMDYPIPMSTGSAENLVAGHWPGADGEGSFVPILEVDRLYEGIPFPRQETLVYKEETRRAISFALHNPVKELKLVPQKLYEFYRADSKIMFWIRKGTLDDPAFGAAAEARWEALANVYYWVVLALAAMAAPLWLSWRDPRKLLVVMIVAYYSFLFGFVFIGEQRFHSAIIPLLSVFAAVSLVALADQIRRRLAVPEPATPEPINLPTSAGEA
jgi:4-amino-4-deoxy-L-arabinose transferase-like glycosyltransferase